MEAVFEQEAYDFLRAMKCQSAKGSKSPYISLSKFSDYISADTIYQLYTECRGTDHFHIRFKLSGEYTVMRDAQEELIRLTLDATYALCEKIAESFDSIEERILTTLPLYRKACEEISLCPEKVAEWLIEKGLHYHAAKNFLQGLN